MEGERNEEDGVQGGSWKTHTPKVCSVRVGVQDNDTVPLLEGEAAQAVNPNVSIDWLGPWNSGE